MENKKNFDNNPDGMKIMIFRTRPMSNDGFKKMTNLKSKKMVYKPLKPVIRIPPYCNTKKDLAELIYTNFGASPEGIIYTIRYWRKVGKWSRRFARLCQIKLWDKPDGSFKFKFLDMGVLRRFGFWKD